MEKTWLETHNNNLEQMKKAFDKWNEWKLSQKK